VPFEGGNVRAVSMNASKPQARERLLISVMNVSLRVKMFE